MYLILPSQPRKHVIFTPTYRGAPFLSSPFFSSGLMCLDHLHCYFALWCLVGRHGRRSGGERGWSFYSQDYTHTGPETGRPPPPIQSHAPSIWVCLSSANHILLRGANSSLHLLGWGVLDPNPCLHFTKKPFCQITQVDCTNFFLLGPWLTKHVPG
jgi:hypothetical protein